MRNPVSRFAYTRSDIGIKRTKYSRNHDHKTTMSAGLLYPLLVDEVLPGDTYSIDTSSLVRMSTPIHPVMDNAYLDLYFFFVPNRIVWDHWKEFMGESPDDPYVNPIEYSVPQLKYDSMSENGGDILVPLGVPPKSILDYMGVPSFTAPESFNALPVRGFCKIWNEWFRDQNLQNAIDVSTGDADLGMSLSNPDDLAGVYWDDNNGTDSDAYVKNAQHGGDLPPVNKYHDYFTSALLEPQKGDPVPVPLNGFAPVYASNLFGEFYQDHYPFDQEVGIDISTADTSNNGNLGVSGGSLAFADTGFNSDDIISSDVRFTNLGADLSLNAQSGLYATISDLRYAFQLQKFLEADNRGGTRYREILKQHFDVTSPDASQQVPEFLGGKRVSINISQVLQTSSTDDVSPQGNTAAYSLTSDRFSAFTKSFTEHGFVFCVGCIRTDHTYSQGIEKFWLRKNKFDYYFPEFANISEQPIFNGEIFNPIGTRDLEQLNNNFRVAKETFGYQEAWADYRYKPNRVSGEFRPTYPLSLDVWHYGDDYIELPYLSSEWIRETRSNIDRTLAVNDPGIDQFICDFYFKMDTVRALPATSIPGLADHH